MRATSYQIRRPNHDAPRSGSAADDIGNDVNTTAASSGSSEESPSWEQAVAGDFADDIRIIE